MNHTNHLLTAQSEAEHPSHLILDKDVLQKLKQLTNSDNIVIVAKGKEVAFEVLCVNQYLANINRRKICELLKTHNFSYTDGPIQFLKIDSTSEVQHEERA